MNKIFDNKQEFTELYRDAVMSISGKSVEAASDLDRFNALAKLVAEKARTVATKSDARATAEGKKRVYYFSIEFLIGRLLDNYLLNFGVRDMVAEALEAAEALAADGVDAEVINMHTIKPLDERLVVASAKKTGRVVTAEEHSIVGGLGEAVASVLAEQHPVPMRRVGVRDVYGESGPAVDLLHKYGLDADGIEATVRSVL